MCIGHATASATSTDDYVLSLNVLISYHAMGCDVWTKQESLANTKVSTQQQCMYEGPDEEVYGAINARNIMLKSTLSGIEDVADNVDLQYYSYSLHV